MTSSGRNRPSIVMNRELINLCTLLHSRVPMDEIPARLKIPASDLRQKLDLLLGEGLAKRTSDGRILPTAVVVRLEDAPKYFQPHDRVVETAARLVMKRLPEVKKACRKTRAFSRVPFEAVSFFVASDVLLDNWQIGNVERLFVKAERTKRAGGRYYYTILEKRATQNVEPFGIYGNTGSQWGAVQIGLYGNDRFSGRSLLSIRDAEFNGKFGFDPLMPVKDARAQLSGRMVDALRGESTSLTLAQRAALSELGLMDRDGSLNIPLLHGDDYTALDKVAAIVTADLVQFLERQRASILATYRNSPYADESSFDEYLMCWYHFFYTAVTNRLRDKRAITIPPSGTVTYFVVP